MKLSKFLIAPFFSVILFGFIGILHPTACLSATLPACSRAPINEHYGIAQRYLESKRPDYLIVKESGEETGGCGGGFERSSKFQVKNVIGQTIGEVVVDGRTREVELKRIRQDYSFFLVAFLAILIVAFVVFLGNRIFKRKNLLTSRS